ncbi:MAG: helix-turn-helix domain-containing protein, partial [Miltoncostaeaceae bacterium]
MDVVTPQEAALRLGLSRSTTYGLIRSGALPATRIGRGLVIEADDLRRFATAPRPTGRPWSARSCWATLAAAGGWPLPFSLSRSERARAGERAREIADLPSHRFDRRAEASTWFCHPSLIDVLRDDGRLCLAGASAAPAHRADILAADLLEAYVRPDDLAAIAREYTLIP